jgi:predicted nucleic acid binding AN1-type Zn finger protein
VLLHELDELGITEGKDIVDRECRGHCCLQRIYFAINSSECRNQDVLQGKYLAPAAHDNVSGPVLRQPCIVVVVRDVVVGVMKHRMYSQ